MTKETTAKKLTADDIRGAEQLVNPIYSDEAFYGQYKKVRNKIRNFDTAELVGACLKYLHAPAKKNTDYLQRHPWLILLLVKWVLIDKEAFVPGRKVPTDRHLAEMFNLMRDFGGRRVARMPSDYDDVRLFLRAMGYQQFFYQRDILFTAITRQLFYFGGVPPEHYIRVKFFNLVGIEIHRFLELALVLISRFSDRKENLISENWFATLEKAYSKEEILAFLSAFSKTIEDLSAELKRCDHENVGKGRSARSPSEYFEQTPFLRFPLIKISKNYLCVDHSVLFQCIEHYVYNLLRSNDASRFMVQFGPLFEQYVEKAVVNMGCAFAKEIEIKDTFGEESTAIDFIVADGEANIFIDAKAAEMSYQGKSTHDSLELAKWLETSALKAIKQAQAVLALLPQLADEEVVLKQRKNNYLITVTYSELYVGNGLSLAACVGKDKLISLSAKNPEHLRIPLENMYFMTIKEFELLSEAVGSNKITLTRAINHAIDQDSNIETQKFEFFQHLQSLGIDLAEPEYLIAKSLSYIDALEKRFDV